MIPLLTRQAARAVDADAVARLHVPTLTLMEHAGEGAFEVLRARFAGRLARVVIVGGVGQNGGDGWVVARKLAQAGHSPRCVLIGDRARVAGDARTNLEALEALGVKASGDLPGALQDATAVVDGLFGTGLHRALDAGFADAVARINACGAPVLALDLPSGIDADTGAVLGRAVRATVTVTFAAHKRGLHQHPGAEHAGEVIVASIGVPAPAHSDCEVIEPRDVAAWLPPRAPGAHKGSAGHVLAIAGAPGRTGAALLCGHAALRMGAGLVTLCARAGGRAALDAKVLELMTAELPEDAAPALQAVLALAAGKDALVVGPGLGRGTQAQELSRRVALEVARPAVLDADALHAFAGELRALRARPAPRVLTPHPGEAAALLGLTTAQVQADRYASATALAQQSGCVVVLKGARTVIADPERGLRVCSRDVPALASAGTGDVLAGALAALLPGLHAFDAASAGVFLHARAGELAAVGDRGLLAREVADALPRALADVRSGA